MSKRPAKQKLPPRPKLQMAQDGLTEKEAKSLWWGIIITFVSCVLIAVLSKFAA